MLVVLNDLCVHNTWLFRLCVASSKKNEENFYDQEAKLPFQRTMKWRLTSDALLQTVKKKNEHPINVKSCDKYVCHYSLALGFFLCKYRRMAKGDLSTMEEIFTMRKSNFEKLFS